MTDGWPHCTECGKPMDRHGTGLKVEPGRGTSTAYRCPDGHEGFVEIEVDP